MAIAKRTIRCDVCGREYTETEYGDGWPGWGQIHGASLNGSDNPALCPDDFSKVMNFVDGLARKKEEG